ncbi:short-chain alcohol dehydrogenase [Cenarchaeum symbiosum A]|uniref:Short-chain alcohol dehydrogenase n=1 Tax=Cenarchaeum symbiosum (strain A) TaxID=414004 RepID=A0RWV4_CENSY|nr:short-chain alcohol dehydrogenase [Cenarchaeum symbiosum A]
MITGSGTGIGLAVARKFAENGASVVILGRRKEPLDEAAAELKKIAESAGCGASIRIFAGVDVADEAAITKMFDELSSSGVTVDILVNNAGVSGPVTCFANNDLEEFRGAVDIHLTGSFWTSREALKVMKKGSKIVTMTTFFAEERPLEQRPYRFRDPYTTAQGAKNRLAEAMSWDLLDRGITSIATNPGPVHSDRIYKTVYPRAALEFVRVSGFEDLQPEEVEVAGGRLIHLLGADDDARKKGIAEAAEHFAKLKPVDPAKLEATLDALLAKIKGIAEKIQANTARMIPDGEFLSQDQVAETVLALCDDKMAKTVNGRVIPADRVFYPVRAHVANAAPRVPPHDYSGGCVLFMIDAADDRDVERATALASHVESHGGTAVCIVSEDSPRAAKEMIASKFHSHASHIDKVDEINRWLSAASTKIGPIAAVVHLSGRMPKSGSLMDLSRKEWDALVDRFIGTPAAVLHRSLEHFAPGGRKDPRLFKGKSGVIVIIGPDLPAGKKASGAERARAEIFRGALRPLTTTVNQELSDVLKSNVRLFTILPGRADGGETDDSRISAAIDYFLTPEAISSGEVIFCVDENRG